MDSMTDAPRCDKCGVELTSAMMAVFCPQRDDCEFMPEDDGSREFIRMLRGEPFDFDTVIGAAGEQS